MSCDDFLYKTLGVSPTASPREISHAFRIKSRFFDENSADNQFDMIETAYEILSDPDLRKIYDQEGINVMNSPAMRKKRITEELTTPKKRRKRRSIQTFSLEVSLKKLYCGCKIPLCIQVKNACEECRGTGVCSKIKKCSTCDGTGRVYLTDQQMKVNSLRKCPDCRGRGAKMSKKQYTCDECMGYGVLKQETAIEAVIPPGTKNEDMICVDGYDDVRVVVVEKKHPVFERNGMDLLITRKITLTQALCGFRIPIEHLDGRVLMASYDGVVKPGMMLTIKNEGMPVKGEKGVYGDLYVLLEVEFPKMHQLGQNLHYILQRSIPKANVREDEDATYCMLKDGSLSDFGKGESEYYDDDSY